jgi:hypothetical protein
VPHPESQVKRKKRRKTLVLGEYHEIKRTDDCAVSVISKTSRCRKDNIEEREAAAQSQKPRVPEFVENREQINKIRGPISDRNHPDPSSLESAPNEMHVGRASTPARKSQGLIETSRSIEVGANDPSSQQSHTASIGPSGDPKSIEKMKGCVEERLQLEESINMKSDNQKCDNFVSCTISQGTSSVPSSRKT